MEQEGLQVVAEASDGAEAVRLAEETNPDVAVLDYSMPMLNGLDAARRIGQNCPQIVSIILTAHTEDQYVLEALRAGVRGYVLKGQATTEIVQAIHEVLRGSVYLSASMSQVLVQAYLAKTELPQDPLTLREREVLQLIAEGHSTKEVALRLNISVKTAESHRTRLMEKLDIHETASLVRYAIRRGIIQP